MKSKTDTIKNENLIDTNNNTNELKDATIKNQDVMMGDTFTKKFIIKKSTYKNLVVMATDKYYDVDSAKYNIIEATSDMLNDIIDKAFEQYKKEKFN